MRSELVSITRQWGITQHACWLRDRSNRCQIVRDRCQTNRGRPVTDSSMHLFPACSRNQYISKPHMKESVCFWLVQKGINMLFDLCSSSLISGKVWSHLTNENISWLHQQNFKSFHLTNENTFQDWKIKKRFSCLCSGSWHKQDQMLRSFIVNEFPSSLMSS